MTSNLPSLKLFPKLCGQVLISLNIVFLTKNIFFPVFLEVKHLIYRAATT